MNGRRRKLHRVLSDPVGRSGWGGSETAGYGVGYARYKNSSAYCAVVAEVEAVTEVRVRRLTPAVDAGLVVNPDGAANRAIADAVHDALGVRVRALPLTPERIVAAMPA